MILLDVWVERTAGRNKAKEQARWKQLKNRLRVANRILDGLISSHSRAISSEQKTGGCSEQPSKNSAWKRSSVFGTKHSITNIGVHYITLIKYIPLNALEAEVKKQLRSCVSESRHSLTYAQLPRPKIGIISHKPMFQVHSGFERNGLKCIWSQSLLSTRSLKLFFHKGARQIQNKTKPEVKPHITRV